MSPEPPDPIWPAEDPPAGNENPLVTPDHDRNADVLTLLGDVLAHADRLAELEDRYEQLAGVFDQIEDHAGDPPQDVEQGSHADHDDDKEDEEQAQVEPLDMRVLVAWVRENLANLIERKIGQTRSPYWCQQWWRHPEPIARLWAVRRSWLEAVETPGNALVVYFEHLDHQLGMLMGPEGPFSRCTNGQHADGAVQPLGQQEPDEGYYALYEQLQKLTPPPETASARPSPSENAGAATFEPPPGSGPRHRPGQQQRPTAPTRGW
jgi:hypothetical protein